MATFRVGPSPIHDKGLFLKSDNKTFATGSSLGTVTPVISMYTFVGGIFTTELNKIFGAQAVSFQAPAAAMVDRIYKAGPSCVAKLVKSLNGTTPTLDNVLMRTKGPDPEAPGSEMRLLHAAHYKADGDYGDHGLVLTKENEGYPLTRALYEVVLNFQISVKDPINDTIVAMQIYELLAFVNHSCDPNVYVKTEGDKISLIALRDINPGDEITRAYSHNWMMMHFTSLPGVSATDRKVQKVNRAFIDRGAFECNCGACFKVSSELYNSNGYPKRVTPDKKKHEFRLHDTLCRAMVEFDKENYVECLKFFRESRRGALKNVAKLRDPIVPNLAYDVVICAGIKLAHFNPSEEVLENVGFAARNLLANLKEVKLAGLEKDMLLRAHFGLIWVKFFTAANKAMKLVKDGEFKKETDTRLAGLDSDITNALFEHMSAIEKLIVVPVKPYFRYVCLLSPTLRGILRKFPLLGDLGLVPDNTYALGLEESIGGKKEEKEEVKNTAAELTEFEK